MIKTSLNFKDCSLILITIEIYDVVVVTFFDGVNLNLFRHLLLLQFQNHTILLTFKQEWICLLICLLYRSQYLILELTYVLNILALFDFIIQALKFYSYSMKTSFLHSDQIDKSLICFLFVLNQLNNRLFFCFVKDLVLSIIARAAWLIKEWRLVN